MGTIGTPLRSKLDTNSEAYQSNLSAMRDLWDQVAEQLASVPSVGGQRYVDRHRKRGKLLVRERIEALVDPDSPFLELSPLIAWGTEDPVGAGTVNGIGVIEGVECLITGSDMTYRGASSNPSTSARMSRRTIRVCVLTRLAFRSVSRISPETALCLWLGI